MIWDITEDSSAYLVFDIRDWMFGIQVLVKCPFYCARLSFGPLHIGVDLWNFK
jgi:hypothetical protein